MISLLVTAAVSQWSPETVHWAQEFSRTQPLFHDGSEMTVWGALQAAVASFDPSKREEISIQTSFSKDPISVLLTKNRFRAPLLIFLPGIFSSTDSPMASRSLSRYHRLGYRVLVIPNSWSEEFVRSRTQYLPGDVVQEARHVLEIARQVIQRLNGYVTRVDLVGESYGGFLGAVAYALDSESRQPVINGTATLLGPPALVRQTISRVDSLIDEGLPTYENICSRGLNSVGFFANVFFAQTESGLNAMAHQCVKPFLAHSLFHANIIRTAELFDSSHELHLVPLDPAERKAWAQALRYRTYLNTFSPTLFDYYESTDQDSIRYWVYRAHQEGRLKIRIMSAQDDFLNNSEQWLGMPNTLTLSWGSHLGFEATPEYEEFLEYAF